MSLKRRVARIVRPFRSAKYWERRYRDGGNSGAGSFGKLAEYKANFINQLVADQEIQSVIEWGCGNGQQIQSFSIPEYIGVDVSHSAIEQCRERFAHDADKLFFELNQAADLEAELSMSLDVLYHLIEDKTYRKHMDQLFGASTRYVLIYSCDQEGGDYSVHVKPRKFTRDVEQWFPEWKLIRHEEHPFPLDKFGAEEGSWSEFFLYEKGAGDS